MGEATLRARVSLQETDAIAALGHGGQPFSLRHPGTARHGTAARGAVRQRGSYLKLSARSYREEQEFITVQGVAHTSTGVDE